jgi:hypothetical protein
MDRLTGHRSGLSDGGKLMAYRSMAPHNLAPVLYYCQQLGHVPAGTTPELRARDAATTAKASSAECETHVGCTVADVHRCADLILAEVPS